MAEAKLKIVTGANEKPTYPHNVEAEQALLGAILLKNNLFDELEGTLRAEHFYMPFNAALFEAIETLIMKGWEANPLTARETMKDRSSFEEHGDVLEHLTSLLENASLATDIKALANIIHTNFLQRQMMDVGAELTLEASKSRNSDDTEELLHNTEGKLFRLAESGSSNVTITDMKNPLKMVINQAAEARQQDSVVVGVTSGLNDVDKMLGGFQKSDLIILAARPSMGKTAFVLNLASNAANALAHGMQGGAGVGVFSLEMSSDQLASRILSSAADIEGPKLTRGDLTDDEFDRLVTVAGELANARIYIDDTPQLHINAFRTRARRMVRQHGVGMIVIDYLQLMRGSGRGGFENRTQEISEISQALKGVARELDVPVIALSQLSRAVENRENKRPQLSDLRESGSIEQDADIVMFLFREDYYLTKQMGGDADDPKFAEVRERLEQVRGKAELLVSKNRKGETGTVNMTFYGPTTTFSDYINTAHYENVAGEQFGEDVNEEAPF